MKRLPLQRLQYNKNNVLIFCRFLGSDDPNTFFSRAQRSRMVYEILATTPFGKEKKGEVGIERMVEEGAYSAAFPLHDVSFSLFICLNYDLIRKNRGAQALRALVTSHKVRSRPLPTIPGHSRSVIPCHSRPIPDHFQPISGHF